MAMLGHEGERDPVDTRLALKLYEEYKTFFKNAERTRRWNVFDDIPWDKIRKDVPEELALVVEKKSFWLFQKAAEVVENAEPWLLRRKLEAEVVENASAWLVPCPRKLVADEVLNALPVFCERKYEAEVVENALAAVR